MHNHNQKCDHCKQDEASQHAGKVEQDAASAIESLRWATVLESLRWAELIPIRAEPGISIWIALEISS